MKHYNAYAPYEPTEILGEVHTIKDGQILLDHIPFENSIEIAGFRQTETANLLPNQFFCLYGADQYYRESNCIIYFNPVHEGETVSVDYLQVGTIITAKDLNEIKEHIENDTIHGDIKYHLPTASRLERGGIRPSYGLNMLGDELFVDIGAGLAYDGNRICVAGASSVSGGGYSFPFTLQPATTESLGGVIPGYGLSIGADGRIDVTIQGGNNFTLNAATEDSLGGIMVGNNLSIDNGTLSSFFYLDTIPCTIDGAMWLQF